MAVLDEMHLRRNPTLTVGQKFWSINWGLVLLICLLSGFGLAMLYSAANGSFQPWAGRQAVRFLLGLSVMFGCALIDIRFWFRFAYPLYILSLLLLVAVEIMGSIGMGAQRWIDLGVIQLQPSEIMKVALVLALARYFHGLTVQDVGRPHYLIPPIFMALAPAALVMRQPDLGTAIMLLMVTGAVFFAAGVRWWKFAIVIALVAGAVPLAWSHLHGYQRNRVLTFLNPESDPLGAGYHIMQSKIALGSGGVLGKGFLQGSQSHLNFLPEKQTDFIFTMLAEELGMVGGLLLLTLFFLVFVYGFAIALRSRNHFGRIVALGLTINLFLYVFINIAMVTGLIPVVGVPLPLVSYGGTAMLAVLFSLGLVISVSVHRDVRIPRRGLREEA
ncbi:cell elongation-specific peptidoglycan biosynthesis regulator RodA [Tistlia consotensis]|uniref:Peptidoglycan glycosyltransferase MrdB n=1 Tax=Tistlia consotensis USBA 355 TaxID=560819 RepID=A0A1Y6BAX2_9PROT|nr:rod shape-determining protein RodA [Tistlia consotensis]SME91239.1 cell elongation-specific peptidoglycan biosynthesis regulator RodA [Tistlia consotensis USBA 355]SNR27233.1 cell elongation-specific peptidoglycan biosynthesis regulator RodA [Tistlia consotensis]